MKITKETIKEMAQKGYQDFIHNDKSEKEVREALRDIVTRYKRDSKMGGYSADVLVDFLYIYFYEIYCKFRNFYADGINELIIDKKELKRLLELHFKCDCLVCIRYIEGQDCKDQQNCEVARTYFQILDKIDKQ